MRPSRYCDSDKLGKFALDKFGLVEHGWPRVQAISQWVHENIEYRYGSVDNQWTVQADLRR